MQLLRSVATCVLLAAVAKLSVVAASGGGSLCVGIAPNQCCQAGTNSNPGSLCSKQLVVFPGSDPSGNSAVLDTLEAATVMSSLVSSITSVAAIADAAQRDEAACTLRNSWAKLGANFTSVGFYFFDERVVITTAQAANITLRGGAAVFTAGGNVNIVFGGVSSTSGNGFPSYPVNFILNKMKVGKTNDLFLSYYRQAFRQPGSNIIADALAQFYPLPPTKTDRGIEFPYRRLYLAGFGAGGIAAMYASFDLIVEASQAVSHVYLFGNAKPGNQDFIDNYMITPSGLRTSVWWNRGDIGPVLPTESTTIQARMKAKLTPEKQVELKSWGTSADFVRLAGNLYWRIVPDKTGIAGVAEGDCVKVPSGISTLYDACPSRRQNSKNYGCGLNFEAGDAGIYHTSIKKCVLKKYGNNVPKSPDSFIPTCIKDLKV